MGLYLTTSSPHPEGYRFGSYTYFGSFCADLAEQAFRTPLDAIRNTLGASGFKDSRPLSPYGAVFEAARGPLAGLLHLLLHADNMGSISARHVKELNESLQVLSGELAGDRAISELRTEDFAESLNTLTIFVQSVAKEGKILLFR